MIFGMVFAALALLAPARTVFGQVSQPLGTWTLFNSSITCDTASYQYDLFIYKHESEEAVHCYLNTAGGPDPKALFIERTCQLDPPHTVSLSWAPDRSVIFYISDVIKRSNAFYGFQSWETCNGLMATNKTEWAWPVNELPVPSTSYTPLPRYRDPNPTGMLGQNRK